MGYFQGTIQHACSGKHTVLSLSFWELWKRMREPCKSLQSADTTVPFRQLTPKAPIETRSHDSQWENKKEMLIFVYLSICANPLMMDSNAVL